MTGSLKIGNAIVCEHLVAGLNNKHTLINTYSGDIVVEEMPANIPVAFYVEVYAPSSFKGHVEIKLLLGKKEVMRGGAEFELAASSPGIIAIPMGMLKVEKNSVLKLILTPDGQKPIKAVEKKLALGDKSLFAQIR